MTTVSEYYRVAEIRTSLGLLADAVTLTMSPMAGEWERIMLKTRLREALEVLERTKPGVPANLDCLPDKVQP